MEFGNPSEHNSWNCTVGFAFATTPEKIASETVELWWVQYEGGAPGIRNRLMMLTKRSEREAADVHAKNRSRAKGSTYWCPS